MPPEPADHRHSRGRVLPQGLTALAGLACVACCATAGSDCGHDASPLTISTRGDRPQR